jgi:predicted MFS family arabinose efflux permease
MILTFLRLSYAITFSFYITFFVVYAEEILFLAPALIAFLLGTRGISDMLLRIPAGRLVDKVDYKWCILTSIGALSLIYILIVEITDIYGLVLLMIVFGLAVGLRVVSEWTMLAEKCDSNARNVAAAYLSTMFNIGSTVGSVLAGIIVTISNITMLFRFASLLMIITFLAALGISRKPQKITINQDEET